MRTLWVRTKSWSGITPVSDMGLAHHMDLPHCDATVYGPPLNTHCNTLERPGDSADF